MSVETAEEYFRRSDDPDATVADVVELFAEDAVLKSPPDGTFCIGAGLPNSPRRRFAVG